MFGDVSLVKKTWALMVVLLACLGILAGAAQWSAQSINDLNEQVAERVIPFQLGALEFRHNVVQIQQWLTDISATRGRDGLDDGFSEAEKHYHMAVEQLDALASMDGDRGEDYRDLRLRLDAYYGVGQRMAQAYVDEGPQGGNATMAEFDAAAEALAETVNGLLLRASAEAAETLARQSTTARANGRNVLIVALVIATVMLGGLLLLVRALQPLGALTLAALRVAENDLTGHVPLLARRDEIGRLAAAVSAMQVNLVQRVQEIAAATQQVYHSVGLMTGVADHTGNSALQQRSETEQVATAMTEMTATVHEVARNTAAAAEAASRAEKEVGSGTREVQQSIASIGRLADEVRKGAEVISRLETDSDNIGAVLDVIKGIAEQTNLLALNAAIEAARAGEQGRGFAVVADEVRTLAQRTQQSTREIQKMIERLQQGAAEAVQVMNEGRSQAEASVTQASQAGRSLDTIRTAVSTIHDMTTQIASAAEEQSAVAEEINRNITNISRVVEQTADGARQTTEASDDLNRLAEQLQVVVTAFRLPA